MTLCSAIDPISPWWNVANAIATCVAAIGTVATVGIAAYVAAKWRSQLRGASKHQTATDVLEAVRQFRYLFYEARNSFYHSGEFPPDYDLYGKKHTPAEKVEGWKHVYTNRWKLLEPQMQLLATMRARASAVLGDEAANAIEELAMNGRDLHMYMQERLNQYRAGDDAVAKWPNQEWVKLVRESVEVRSKPADRNDRYSVEFENKLRAVETIANQFI